MKPGQIIGEKYRLLRVVRSGGVSIVYRGESIQDGSPVAIKVIHVGQAGPDLRKRIAREVEILHRLDHPNIVHCFDHGSLENDRMYLALEWLQGDDLSDYSAQHSLTLRQVLQLLVQLAGALQASHDAGVVHRDIKPANIYLKNPQPGLPPDVRLIDFGVAKAAENNASVTRAGAILGTPAYMAPEQASQAMDADGRADLFSLGVVAYELVSGKLPWTTNTDLARLARILVDEPVPLLEVVPNVPEAVSNLVMGMLDNDLERRIQSATAVSDFAYTCLDVLRPEELDSTYITDGSRLGDFVRAETLDLPEPQAKPGTPGPVHEPAKSPSRDLPPPSVLIANSGPNDIPAPSVRYRSVVVASGTDKLLAPRGDSGEEHHDTRELFAVVEGQEWSETMDEPPEEPTEFKSLVSLSASQALASVRASSMRAVPLSVLDASEGAGLLSYVDHLPTSLLYGRVAGLDRLERRVVQSLGVSQPTLTLVIGPAGIGKTRVRTELAKMVRTRHRPPRVFSGRAEESFRTTPYAFLRRFLLTEARVTSADDDEVTRAKVLRMIPEADTVRRLQRSLQGEDELGANDVAGAGVQTAFVTPELLNQDEASGAEEERAVVAAFMCEALGVAYPDIPPVLSARHDPQLLGHRMRYALDVVLRALAEEAGIVVLVDDAHLLDRQSAEILQGLTDGQHRVQIGVVAFALPTILDADAPLSSPLLSESQDGREVVQLGPLESRAAREMARGLVAGPVHADALEALVQRACGNPLYLEQLVHAVQVSGALVVGSDGEYELADIEATSDVEPVPPTVAAAVSARLSYLKPAVQRTLTAAAVFGEVFWAEGVSKLGGQDIGSVMNDLDQLLTLNLVRRRSTSRYRDQTELEFTHAVVRSVALSRLKRPRRLRFEVGAATYLESVGESDKAVIARHFAQGRLHRRAAELYAPAAERALALGDVVSAGILAEEGLRAAEGGAPIEARIQLLALLEQVALARRDWEAGREVLDSLADLVETAEDQAQLLLRRSRLAAVVHRYEESKVEAQEAERAFKDLDISTEVARSHLYGAEASEAIGDGRGALRGYLSALVGLGREGASVDLGRSSRGLARIAVASGDYKNAENRFRSALVSSRAARDYVGVFMAQLGLADVGRLMGDVDGASAHLEDALLVGFDRQQRLAIRTRQIGLLDAQGRHDEAQAQFISILATMDGPDQGTVRRQAILGLGKTFRRRTGQDSRLKVGTDVLAQASTLLAAAQEEALTDDPALVSALQLAASIVEALLGNSDDARALARTAQEHFQAEGALAGDEPPAVYFTVARVAQLTEDSEDAINAGLSKAISQLDNICTRLDSKGRGRYLERPLARAIIDSAQACGVSMPRELAVSKRKRSRR